MRVPNDVSLSVRPTAVGGTSAAELRLCAALCGLKIVLMPALYRGAALALGVGSGATPFLAFIGVLPASASVYSLASTKGLEPRVLGPLVPLTMLLCVALVLLPLSPAAAGVGAADAPFAFAPSLLAEGRRSGRGSSRSHAPPSVARSPQSTEKWELRRGYGEFVQFLA